MNMNNITKVDCDECFARDTEQTCSVKAFSAAADVVKPSEKIQQFEYNI